MKALLIIMKKIFYIASIYFLFFVNLGFADITSTPGDETEAMCPEMINEVNGHAFGFAHGGLSDLQVVVEEALAKCERDFQAELLLDQTERSTNSILCISEEGCASTGTSNNKACSIYSLEQTMPGATDDTVTVCTYEIDDKGRIVPTGCSSKQKLKDPLDKDEERGDNYGSYATADGRVSLTESCSAVSLVE
jgi:hypothetical protein